MPQAILTLALLLISTIWFAAPTDQPRVFIDDSQSWEVSGHLGGADAIGGTLTGGARPQTAEIVKTFHERCPQVIVTNRQEKADYLVVLEHEGGKSLVLKDNKFAVFNKDGDAIKSGSTRSLGNAVKNSCAAIRADWQARGARRTQAEPDEKKN
jgi:hypothetical protein